MLKKIFTAVFILYTLIIPVRVENYSIRAKYGKEISVSLDYNQGDDFYVVVNYMECPKGNRSLQYMFLSSTVNVEKYLSDKYSTNILGGYSCSKVKYIRQEIKNGKITFYFNVDKKAQENYEKDCEIADIDSQKLGDELKVTFTRFPLVGNSFQLMPYHVKVK